MARSKIAYVCSDCGGHSVKWQGQCPDCSAWNTLQQISVQTAPGAQTTAPAAAPLGSLQEEPEIRYPTGFAEFDRVLGSGLVPGSVVLLGGDPGVGKSTLLQQVAAKLPPELRACYATGEESLRQVAQRSKRLGLNSPGLSLLADTSLENILQRAEELSARVVFVDSIQTMSANDLPSAPGSVAQLKECVSKIVRFAKQREVAVFLIGHVTKEGAIAGPRVVEHMVDTVLYFESDPASRYTIIRAVKNRFGASSEMGVFAMTSTGFREVRNPSAIFLSGDSHKSAGSVVSVAWEGSRPLLLEIQALVADANTNYAKRLAQGIDQNRLALLVAVLQKHGGIDLGNQDVFVNVVGGLRFSETAADLPSVLALVSSFRDRVARSKLMSFGEIGLAGEIRPVKFGGERIAEAAKQGFEVAVVPELNVPQQKHSKIKIVGVRKLDDALREAFA